MDFTKETIEEFMGIYEEVFGEKITQDEATIMFRKLVNLYRVIGKTLPEKEHSETTQPF